VFVVGGGGACRQLLILFLFSLSCVDKQNIEERQNKSQSG
jgi:hypothetical protein